MRFFSVLILLGAFIPGFGQETWETCRDFSTLVREEAQAHAQLIQFRTLEATANYDLRYARMEWEIDPAVRYIRGVITYDFVSLEADFRAFHLELTPGMMVQAVEYEGQGIGWEHQGNGLLKIELPHPMAKGATSTVRIAYEGNPPESGFGSFVRATHQGVPVIWTLSEPYGARDWWPCKQDLSDKLDSVDIIVRTPAAYRAAANGVLVEEHADGEDKIYHWRHRYPITTYLVGIAVTNYAVYSDFVSVPGGEPIEVLNYVYPEQEASIRVKTGTTVQVMALFNELFGLYPFAAEKYGHAQFSWGGGMEHQTMSFMGSWSHLIQAHELAHQWFGDKITCGSWQDIWLNEGFATYAEGLTYNFGLGSLSWKTWLQNKINSVTGQSGGAVFVSDTTSVNRIFSGRLSYDKGAMLLHMLRWKLGDEAFFRGLRDYLNDPALAYGYARTADLQRNLEAQSGLSLDEFFADWLYGEGYPSYTVNGWAEGGLFMIEIQQRTSHPSVDFFELPVPIRLAGQGRDTILVFDHRFSGQRFTVELPFKVEEMTFDPDLWLLSKGNEVNLLLVGTGTAQQERQPFVLSPNPARGSVQINGGGDAGMQALQVTLYDGLGRMVRQTLFPAGSRELSLDGLPGGIYFCHLLMGNERQVLRLVVSE